MASRLMDAPAARSPAAPARLWPRFLRVLLSMALVLSWGCAPQPSAGDRAQDQPALVDEPLAVLSPNGGETWPPGGSVVVTWTPSAAAGARVDLHLLRSGTVMRAIATGTTNDGMHTWSVPTTVDDADDYALRVSGAAATRDESDGPFTIAPPSAANYFALVAGRTLTYRTEEGETVTARVLPDPVEVAGVRTRVVAEDTGRRQYYSVDDRGVHLHRVIIPETGQTLTFHPPLHLTGPTLVRGAGVRSAGTMVTETAEAPAQTTPYAAVARIEGFPAIRVPAGRLATAKLGGLLILDGQTRILFDIWFAPGLGEVHHTGDRTLTLVAVTDAPPTPNPAAAAGA